MRSRRIVISFIPLISVLMVILSTSCTNLSGGAVTDPSTVPTAAEPKTVYVEVTVEVTREVEVTRLVEQPNSSPLPTVTAAPSAASSSTPTPVVIKDPEFERRCPGSPEVQLSELGLDDRARLIVYPDIEREIQTWGLIDSKSNFDLVFDDNFEGGVSVWVSPNKQWFALRIAEEDHYSYFDLWVASIDGQELKKIIKDVYYTTVFRWSDSETLIAIDHELSRPAMLISPLQATPVYEELEPVILELVDWNKFAFSPNGSKMIYFRPAWDPPSQWELHDYDTGETVVAFPGMDVAQFRLNSDAWINWQEENLSLAVISENTIELAMDIPPDDLTHQGFPMYKVMFPEESKLSDVYWWSRDSRYIAFRRFLEYDKVGPSIFYVLDTNRWVLYDYCITTSTGWGGVSADERFIALNDYSDPDRKGIIVLEIATGLRARIDGYWLLDWGLVSNN